MIVGFLHLLFLNYFLFAEASYRSPYDSIARDLRIIRNCNSTYPTDRTSLNLALEFNRFYDEPDRNFKCFLFCLYRANDWINEDGVFNNDLIKVALEETSLDESSIEYLLATCTEIDVEDRCDRAHQFTECFWTETDKSVNLTKHH